ncbi:MAG: hypothetical protein NC825_06035 [Candidatus Omnitrophica bacterium]|nr:hypothetical protein [Candidatus Omnitrophota bacterium]
MEKKKAVVLISGGLDSTLATHIMLQLGIELVGVHFTGIFCKCPSAKTSCIALAHEIASKINIPIKTFFKGMDYLEMVKTAPHGYGRGLNPCIDCRIYMLKKVRTLMSEVNASFIVTGEVIGQRPMSQHKKAMEIIEKESGTKGLILRPLSAHLLPPTIPEIKGIVDRNKLLAFSGRSRIPQMKLARSLGLKDYPCPSGGCLLTDRNVAIRVADLFLHKSDFTLNDARLTTFGRHFRLDERVKIVLGRNKHENERLFSMGKTCFTLYIPENFPGPTALVPESEVDESYDEIICGIVAFYSRNKVSGMIRKYSAKIQRIIHLPEPLSEEVIKRINIINFSFHRICQNMKTFERQT